MSASLFLSPGGKGHHFSYVPEIYICIAHIFCGLHTCSIGDKFYQFLLRLSMYVLRVACLEEAKAVGNNGLAQIFHLICIYIIC